MAVSEIDPKLSRAYREASRDEPSAALDAAILAAARKQAEAKPRRRRSAWMRWMAPASAVATLALGVAIALLVEREQPATTEETAARAAAPQPQIAPPAAETAKARAADGAAPAQGVKQQAPVGAPAAQAPAATAPPPAMPAPAPGMHRAEPALRLDAPAAQAFPAENREAALERAAPKAAAEANVARDAALGAAGAPAPAAAGRLAPLRQQAAPRSAQIWLDEIIRLRREGREKEAVEQLAEFRKAYPAYALPESLMSK